MKRPMLQVVLPYLGGILAAEMLSRFGIPLPLWPMLACIATGAAVAFHSETLRKPLLPLVLAISGAANFTLNTAVLSPVDLRAIAPEQPVIATLRGRLLESPIHRVYSHQDEVTYRTQARVQVDSIRFQGGDWTPAFGAIAVSTSGAIGPPYFKGRQVEIEGVLKKPALPVAPGTFDYAEYLRRHRIHYQLQSGSTNDWRCRESEHVATSVPFNDRFGAWAKSALAQGLPAEDQPLQLLWAMTLGWRTALTGEVSEPFMRSGTMHVFAISGLHIALIAGLLVAVLRVCRVPRRWCALIVIPLLWLYTGATGWQASAIRSTIMMSVIVAGWLLTRPADLLNSTCAAAFIILLWEPLQLFQASFQLSFSVVLSLALLAPVLEHARKGLFKFDPWVPDDLRPRWQRWLRRPIDYLGSSLAISIAAWLGSAPLIATYFNLLTPVSLLANVIVVPLSSGALACSLGSLLLGPFVPIFGELFNHSAWFFMMLMIRVSEWAAAVPAGCFHVRAPGTVLTLTYYATLAAVLTGAFSKPRLRIAIACGLLIPGLLGLALHLHDARQIRLTVLPMNGGGAQHFSNPGERQEWLIDCGDESSAGYVLKPYLKSQGVNRLKNLLITHGDVHHAGGTMTVLESFRPRNVWFSAVPSRSGVYRAIQQHLSAEPGLSRILHRGQSLPPWTVLHPADTDRFPQADDNAIVLFGVIGNVRVLLLSDLGKPGQNQLLSRHPDLRADLVLSGIPTQSEPLADALLRTLQPRLIIVADAEYPASQRASARLRDRLATHAIPVLYTRDTGALTITFQEDDWRITATRTPE